ncbi:hypothetical protein AOLI_G00307580 [Acnodon oligacanthus]
MKICIRLQLNSSSVLRLGRHSCRNKRSIPWHPRFSHPLSDSLRVWYLGNILPTHLVTSLCMFRTACSEPLAAATPLRHSAALQASLSGPAGDASRVSHQRPLGRTSALSPPEFCARRQGQRDLRRPSRARASLRNAGYG